MSSSRKNVKADGEIPAGRYYLLIAISVIAVIGSFGGAGLAVSHILVSFSKDGGMDLYSMETILKLWLPIVWIVLTVVTYRPLAKIRQAYRDKVEYDKFGNLRKAYSTMSAQERRRIEEAKMTEMQRVAPDSLIKSHTHKGPEDPDKKLNAMTGLGQVKASVSALAAQMKFDWEHRKDGHISGDGDTGYHMCFSGPPGTGKTTVARIVTSYLYKYKVIKENKCIEIDGNMLSGGTPSETTLRTTRFLQKAIGGVLFIDEAYAMIGHGSNSEAVATLIKFMEDYRKDFVLIIAGYDNEMKALVASNPGFQSRIQHYIAFPSYSTPELREIFLSMAGSEGFAVDGDAYPMFDEIMERERNSRNFGNARTVRNCLAASIRKHKTNYEQKLIPVGSLYKLVKEDITYEKGII